jgi:acyl transferase domain-containing protein
MLKQKEIIPNIHYVTPNPRIDFAKFLMDVQTEASVYALIFVLLCI